MRKIASELCSIGSFFVPGIVPLLLSKTNSVTIVYENYILYISILYVLAILGAYIISRGVFSQRILLFFHAERIAYIFPTTIASLFGVFCIPTLFASFLFLNKLITLENTEGAQVDISIYLIINTSLSVFFCCFMQSQTLIGKYHVRRILLSKPSRINTLQ